MNSSYVDRLFASAQRARPAGGEYAVPPPFDLRASTGKVKRINEENGVCREGGGGGGRVKKAEELYDLPQAKFDEH